MLCLSASKIHTYYMSSGFLHRQLHNTSFRVYPFQFLLVMMVLQSSTQMTYGDYIFPEWSVFLGWVIAAIPFIPIPVFIVFKLSRTRGSIKAVSAFRQFKLTLQCQWGRYEVIYIIAIYPPYISTISVWSCALRTFV